jgi:hypothetical protein
MGFGALSYSDILAFFFLYRMPVQPWEVDLILAFDNVASKMAEKDSQERERQKAQKGIVSE